jgi:hypothetical protein
MKVFEKTNRIFLLTLIGCLSFSLTPTTSGFITDAHRLVKSNLLISKVHEPSWKIGYRYGADCKPKDRQDKVLEETITRALQAWLTPLRELQPDRPITNNFTFHLQEDFHGDTDENLEGRWAVDVRITFRCARVSSFALIGSGDAPPDIFVHWGDEENDTLSDLTHELGHAFGLADTYLHRGIRSTGGLPGTVGTQRSVEDVNADGVVNILDLVVVASNFGQTGKSSADVNGDGVVDIRDLVKVANALQ